MTKRLPLLVGSSLLAILAAGVPACSSEERGASPSDGAGGGGELSLPIGGNASANDAGSGNGDALSSEGGETSNTGNSTSGGASASVAGNPGTSGTPTGNTACDNGIDDDGDGLIDGFDPECTGPLDNDEGSFATGIPGDNKDPKWQDCFFDGNSGAGDDGCRYHTDCLYGELPSTDKNCTVTEECVNYCKPLTQNGCDCFGCCTVQLPNGDTVDVVEAATCSLANIDDSEACPRCAKNEACANDCGECELCLGKTELPESCTPPAGGGGSGGGGNTPGGEGGAPNLPPPAYTCDNGEQVCGPDHPCEYTYEYCSLGCCITRIR